MTSSAALFRIWLSIGLQSFGGGVTTMTLIRRTAVDRYQWITDEQFNRDWALCQMTPGINLIAMTILVGKQAAGFRGAGLALLGLLLPSATVTALMTASFVSIHNVPAVQSVLGGVLPAAVGLGLVTSFQMAKPPLWAGWKQGIGSFLFVAVLLVACAVLMYLNVASTPIILLGAGLLGAAENVIRQRISKKEAA